VGTDFRGLLDLLIEAVKLDERPSMVVNGKTYVSVLHGKVGVGSAAAGHDR